MIKINLSKEEVFTPEKFHSIRYRVELENYAEESKLQKSLKDLQDKINIHIETEKKKDQARVLNKNKGIGG